MKTTRARDPAFWSRIIERSSHSIGSGGGSTGASYTCCVPGVRRNGPSLCDPTMMTRWRGAAIMRMGRPGSPHCGWAGLPVSPPAQYCFGLTLNAIQSCWYSPSPISSVSPASSRADA